MSIEIKRSIKPVEYNWQFRILEKRLEKVINNERELIWFLEHKRKYIQLEQVLNNQIY